MKGSFLSNELCSVAFAKCNPIRIFIGTHHAPFYKCVPRNYEVLGRVCQGMAFGLLALAPDGSYVRINGDTIELLDEIRIRELISRYEKVRLYRENAAARYIPAPPVTVRKRRMLPEAHTQASLLVREQHYEGMHLPHLA